MARGDLKLVEHWPAGGGVCVDAPLRLTFDKPPVLGDSGKIAVYRVTDGQPVETITLGEAQYVDRFGMTGGVMLRYEPVRIDGTRVSIRLRAHCLGYGETYSVRFDPGVFKDFTGLADDWKFTTKPAPARNPDRVEVATDGSADFCTVQGAVDQIEPHRTQPATIYIHRGRYEELVRIGRERRYVHLLGESRKGTVIASTNNEKLNPGWNLRAVLGVEGDDFRLENLTVQNTTPYRGSQAEAVYVNAERCVLRDADFLSYQDTLNLNGTVYVTGCTVEGDVDYVWGYGSAFFEHCELRTMHDGYVVQARNPVEKPGYIFSHCTLTAAPGVKHCWLARIEADRFPGSQVAFIHCQIGPHILAAGWEATRPAGSTLCFAEFQSAGLAGEPLDVSHRDPSGKQLTEKEAAQFDPARVLPGFDGWKPK